MSTAIDEIYRRFDDDLEPPEIDWSDSKIRKFYAGKTVLLTGATGFMGKVFVEKILRDCPDLKGLYVVVRHKKGVAPKDKMKKYFQNQIFSRLRAINPNFEEKVVTVTGDLEMDKLGLSIEDRQSIIDNVDIIIHNGALTSFDKRVSITLKINVLGTKHMLDLAMECKHLQVFVYVSTVFSQCHRKSIEETFYESPADLKMVHDLIASDEATKDGLTQDALKMFFGGLPNVYCFSKAIAENVIKEYGEKANFALGLYRPSIVIGAVKEPLPGWTVNTNLPSIAFLGGRLGLVHTGYQLNHPVDFIPVDYTINSLLATTYDVFEQWKSEKQVLIYNYGSATLNPISIYDMHRWTQVDSLNSASIKMVWYPFGIFCNTKWKGWIGHFFLHFIPAVLVDFALLCMRKKPRAVQLFFFGIKHLDSLDFFGNGNWTIQPRRAFELYDRLSKADQSIFYFDIRKLDWPVTVVTLERGRRVHMLKEPFDNLEQARRHFLRLKRLHYAIVTIIYLLGFYFVVNLLLRLFNLVV